MSLSNLDIPRQEQAVLTATRRQAQTKPSVAANKFFPLYSSC
jgi:hypothetical protein